MNAMEDSKDAHNQNDKRDKRTIAVPNSVVGLWGEALAVKALRREGFDIHSWDGDFTPNRDLIVGREGRRWPVQVRTTRKSTGAIKFEGPGQRARDWQAEAIATGASGAFYIFVQITTPGRSALDLERGLITIAIPEDAVLVAVSAASLADDVDACRRTYGLTPRQRAGKHGERTGDLLPESGAIFPVHTGQYPYLEDFLQTL